jgi:hypothetical protein
MASMKNYSVGTTEGEDIVIARRQGYIILALNG